MNKTQINPWMASQAKRRPEGIAPGLPVKVTEETIANAQDERRNSSHCMIAEAVKMTLREAGIRYSCIAVDIQTIRFTDLDRKERYTYLTPRIGQHYLVDFDQGAEIPAFTFRLNGPSAQVTKSGHSRNNPEEQIPTLSPPARSVPSRIPRRIGGRTPPTAALSAGTTGRPRGTAIGRRRAFGLQGLQR